MKLFRASTRLLHILFTAIFLSPAALIAQCGCDHNIPANVVYLNGDNYNFQPGDVVCLEPGVKQELWILNVHGTPANPITFKNCGGEVKIQQPNLYSYVVKISDSDHIRFSGAGDPGIEHGIKLIGEGTEDSGSGIELDGIYSNIEIDHVEISNNEFAGIWAKEMPFDCSRHRGNFTSFDLIIRDNYIHDVGTEAIYINRESAPYTSAQLDCNGTPIYPYGIEGLRIINNDIRRTGWDAIEVHGANWNTEIFNNRIEDFGLEGDPGQQKGIYLGDGTSGKCFNNTLKGGRGEGIVVQGFGNNRLYNNVIDRTARQGIICRERVDPNFGEYELINNTIIQPGLDGILIQSNITGNVILNNIIIQPSNIEFITLTNGATATIDGNYLDMDINNVKFKDVSQGNYQLTDSSYLLNRGVDVASYSIFIDQAGAPRTIGSIPDVGAYEFQSQPGLQVPPVVPGPPPFNAETRGAVFPYDGNFLYGSNVGFYPGWTDEQLGDIAAGNPDVGEPGLGIKTFRPAFPNYLAELFGYRVRIETFEHFKSLGMKDHTMFLGFPEDNSIERDPNSYCSDGSQSWLFRDMYKPIWDNGEGGTPVNEENYFALYVYKTVYLYKDYIKFWQIVNEPDFDGGGAGWFPPASEDPTFAATNWWDNDPDPCVLGNMQAPIQHYVRMLRIAYEIVHAIAPDDYVTLGGIGYPSFLDAILRNSDNPGWHNPEGVGTPGTLNPPYYPHTGGAYFDMVSYHEYPQFAGNLRTYVIDHFEYNRHSDAAVQGLFDKKAELEQVLINRGFDDISFPKKLWSLTEMNISRKPFPYLDPGSAGENYIGGDEVQRNFIIKAYVRAQMEGLAQMYIYNLGDEVPEWEATTSFELMGLYKHLDNITPYSQEINSSGVALRSIATELEGYTFSEQRTAALNLPANVKGGAFVNAEGTYKYVLWAETLNDLSEYAQAAYSFPQDFGYAFEGMIIKPWDQAQNPNPQVLPSTNIPLTGSPVFLESVNANGGTFPVEFLHVEALAQGNRVKLNWTTASESNNHYFTVERSIDRRIFIPLQQVASKGNSLSRQDYQSYDNEPLEGNAFYRIKQTDFDGEFSYSEIVEVSLGDLLPHSIKVFPIPSRQGSLLQLELNLGGDLDLRVKLVDATGRILHEHSKQYAAGIQRHSISTTTYQPGIYYLAVEDLDGMVLASKRILILP